MIRGAMNARTRGGALTVVTVGFAGLQKGVRGETLPRADILWESRTRSHTKPPILHP